MSSPEMKALLIQMAEYYERSLSEPQLRMYASDLAEFSTNQVSRAFEIYRRDPKNFRFPLPAQLIGILRPKTDERDDAIAVARKLQESAAAHHSYWDTGYLTGSEKYYLGYNAGNSKKFKNFHDAAVYEVGEIGAEVIRRYGGWKRFFADFQETDAGQFHAQLREMIESTIKRVKSGSLNHLPRLADYAPKTLFRIGEGDETA